MAKTKKTNTTAASKTTIARDSLGRPKAPAKEQAPEQEPATDADKATKPSNPTRKATKTEREAALAIAKAAGLPVGETVKLPGGSTIERRAPEPKPAAAPKRLVVETIPEEEPKAKEPKAKSARAPRAAKAEAEKAEKPARKPRANLPAEYQGVTIPQNLYQQPVEALQALAEKLTGKRPTSTKQGYLAHLISMIVREYRPANAPAKGLRLQLSPELTDKIEVSARTAGIAPPALALALLTAALDSRATYKAAVQAVMTAK